MMTKIRQTGHILSIVLIAVGMQITDVLAEESAKYIFVQEEGTAFTNDQKTRIQEITAETIEKTRQLLPTLSIPISFTIQIIDRDLSMVKGVTGRADRIDEIEISLSSVYDGGLDQAIEDGLQIVLFHELHHTVRGWLIYENKFGQGIDIAAINEGLADVFAEIQVGHPHGTFPGNPDFDSWTQEIIALPKNANYGEWMNLLPDGRIAVGYRTGAWLVKEAMNNSGINILELSELSVSDIYGLAGYSHTPE